MSKRELRTILERVQRVFGGYSLDSPSDGAWVASDCQIYREKSQKLEVVVAKEEVEKARKLFMAVGKKLGQRAIYFEVREGGEIIDLE